ncbi:Type 1 glutamine amidotransferase-like domain-containing protein [Candidatus Pacearchaeota archaeon]|nr:Type 1 glutamine amidotransferase-like domain-containing protein [Candidatus Pacearchaeota archaeon]
MKKKIYLEGGGEVKKGEAKEIDKKAIDNADNKNVYVLDLSSKNKGKQIMWKEFFPPYFKELGANKVDFISNAKSPEEIRKYFQESGILYIPGGDTELLIKNVQEKGLVNLIKSFNGVLIGMSAGAYLMCNQYIKIREENITKVGALQVVPIQMKAHYEEKFDSKLLKLSKGIDIYGVSNKAVIIWDRKLEFIGDIYLFSKGKKTKIN